MVAGLAACADSPRPPPPSPVVSSDPAAACLAGLDQRHIVYERIKDWTTPEGCGIQAAVKVKKTDAELSRPAMMTCSLASTIWDYETNVVQPAAQATFHQAVRKIWHVGTYDCRAERSEHSERKSQHALGKAIDVTAFELDDGTKISVLRDWRDKGDKSEFLHTVAKGACAYFSVVMTPNANALHHDHLHLDIGPYKHCGY
jgi:hypothetical protein